MKSLLTFLFIISCTIANAQDWNNDLAISKKIAQDQNRNIILVFQGSDWCGPCIKLEKEIWSSEEFKSYAKEHFVLLKADFPKKKANKLSDEQQKKNDLLAEKYNLNGYFPLVVILDKTGKVLGTTGYKNITPTEYIKLLSSLSNSYLLMAKLLFILVSLLPLTSSSQEIFQRKLKLMGSRYDITVVANDSIEGNKYIDIAANEVARIEKIISSWDSNSQTSEIIRNAGIKPVVVDKELFDLIKRSIAISKLTDGAFDISYASMDKVWKFDGSMKTMPTEDEIKASVSKVGYQNIILNEENHSVFLKLTGMKIGFGAIGKGYSADKAKDLLMSLGVKAGIINASGDMNTWGKQPNGENWKVAITNPFNKEKAFGLFAITKGAVVTSGDYEKYVVFNNVKYTHIIDPRTGYPASKITSVTVFAPKAELADALATSIFVMGSDVGINFVNQIPNIECIIIDSEGDIIKSKNININ